MAPSLGVKIYGLDWQAETGLTLEEGVQKLVSQRVDFVILNNSIDSPVPVSAEAAIEPLRDSPTSEDRELRALLRDAGIRFYEVFPVFMDGGCWNEDPSIRPIDGDGNEMKPFDWYVGLCPTHPGRMEERLATIRRVVEELEPDGILLDWIRFPGFWERWVPGVDLEAESDYCRCARCEATSASPGGSSSSDAYPRWILWKQEVIASAAGALAGAARSVRPKVEVLVNMVGLPGDEPGDPVGRLLGQSYEALEPYVDGFAIMLYHQMVDRDPVRLIRSVVADANRRTDKPLLPCIQLAPTYTDGPYALEGRSHRISSSERRAAIEAAVDQDPVGVILYRWQDLLALPSSALEWPPTA